MKKPSLDELIQSIYACALDPQGWDKALTGIRRYLEASAINLIGLEVATYNNPFLYSSNIPQDQGHLYQEYWHQQDPWVKAAGQKGLGMGGATYHGQMLMDRSELVKTAFYNEWLAGQDIGDVLCTNLWGQEPVWGKSHEFPRVVLCFFRGRGNAAFDEDARRKLVGLSQHLNQAFQIALKMGVLGRNSQLGGSTLNTLNHAVILLDSDARILFSNSHGSRLLGQEPALLQVQQGAIIGLTGDHFPSLDQAMTLAKQGQASLIIWRPSTETGLPSLLKARLTPMPDHLLVGFSSQRTTYMLIVDTGAELDEMGFQSFCDLYRFSRSERKVLRQLILGSCKAEDVARTLNISLPTVRTHLLKLRTKAGVRRISDLTNLALIACRFP